MAQFHSSPNQSHYSFTSAHSSSDHAQSQLDPNQLYRAQLAKAKTKTMLRLLYIALCGVFGYLFTSRPNSEIFPFSIL